MANSKKPKLDKSRDSAVNDDKPATESTQEAPEAAADEPTTADGKSAIVGKKFSGGRFKSYLHTYWKHKKWAVPATVLVVVLLVLAVPFTRYLVLGLFVKGQLSVSVVDSTTNNPISDASLQLGGVSAKTAANGKASLKVPLGNGTLSASKQYYKSASEKVLVSYTKSHNSVVVRLVATGRQVPVIVTNRITGKPVANAEFKVLDTTAKTNKQGQATIVLPADKRTLAGTVSASNYNDVKITVQVTTQAMPANSFAITPSGSVYFLSNLSGKVDVVKTNLDGTGRKTVLAGTGNESATDTVLLASRDWKYLALYAQRKATGNPELDLIDTSTSKMSNIDEGNAAFTLVGWAGDRFVYEVDRNAVQEWQNSKQVLKSFNAPNGSLTTLAQTMGLGSSSYDSVAQSFGSIYIVDNRVIYPLNWTAQQGGFLSSRSATLNSINPDGSNGSVVKSFSYSVSGYPNYYNYVDFTISAEPYDEANALALSFWDGTKTEYFEYQNGQVTTLTGFTDQKFYSSASTTYLLSPSGNQTFWSEPTDGKNSLLVGDQDGKNSKNIASLSDYSPYGWYTDNYLLVSKNGSELYIMPVNGGNPIHISDYYKPSQFFRGYGGGYGGL